MNLGLAGKVALITGAAGGLGLECARLLVEEGALVALADVDLARTEAARAQVGGQLALACDVTSQPGARALVAEVVAKLGRLDILIPAAGVHHTTRIPDVPADEWDLLQDVNVKGTFLCAQAALEPMTAQRSGSMVLFGSIAGQVGGLQSGIGYATSKSAIFGMAKSLARHGGPSGVRVNVVNPGLIASGMSLDKSKEDFDATVAATPLRRAGSGREVASVVVWLASDGASFVTGAHVDVNGGLLMA